MQRTESLNQWDADISVDDQGEVSFHGTTSALHEPGASALEADGLEGRPAPFGTHHGTGAEDFNAQATKRLLVNNAAHYRPWEDWAISNTALQVSVTKELATELLNYHWCWIHPLFIFVYRPAFIRDMSSAEAANPNAPQPAYFSDTLLKVVYSHCCRFLDHDVVLPSFQPGGQLTHEVVGAKAAMEKLTSDARISLGMQTIEPSSIPTIQALLQQSAREGVFGRSSQAWLYSGMAFRMAFDMGIHLPSDKLQSYVKSLNAEDIEVRKRVFWSCYTWDKMISIYLGRMPNFTPPTEDVPYDFLDDFTDKEMWTPYYGEVNYPSDAVKDYPPHRAYIVSTFTQLCKLSIILNDLMSAIYASKPPSEIQQGGRESIFVQLSKALKDFWLNMPRHLKIDPQQPLPKYSPPAHIVSVNLLYHTTIILLHRPFILGAQNRNHPTIQRSYQTCIVAATAIHDILVLQLCTFGAAHLSYLNAYAGYMAAAIAVMRFERELKPGADGALNNLSPQNLGLNFLVEVLQKTAAQMPVLKRSVNIIRKRMKYVLDRQSSMAMEALFQSSQQQAVPDIPRMTTPFGITQLQTPIAMEGAGIDFGAVQPGIMWQEPVRPDMRPQPFHEGSFMSDDYLPTFPGQRFALGPEHSFVSSGLDPNARSALMGYNLDQQPRLQHANFDFNFNDPYFPPQG